MKRKILLTSLLILTLTSCGRNTIDNGYSNFNISEWDTKLINKNITQLTTEEKSYHSLIIIINIYIINSDFFGNLSLWSVIIDFKSCAPVGGVQVTALAPALTVSIID